MLSGRAALALSLAIALSACRLRADVETSNPRPVLRMAMRPTELLNAFLNLPHRSEQATALENTKLMTWTTSEIEEIVMRRPRLAVGCGKGSVLVRLPRGPRSPHLRERDRRWAHRGGAPRREAQGRQTPESVPRS